MIRKAISAVASRELLAGIALADSIGLVAIYFWYAYLHK